MNEYAINIVLLNITNDNNYNEEVRELANKLLKSNCSTNAKLALIEACIENNK